jgi:hypothetical protein
MKQFSPSSCYLISLLKMACDVVPFYSLFTLSRHNQKLTFTCHFPATVFNAPVLHRLLTSHVPNAVFPFLYLNTSKHSVHIWGPVWHSATCQVTYSDNLLLQRPTPSWKNIFRLSDCSGLSIHEKNCRGRAVRTFASYSEDPGFKLRPETGFPKYFTIFFSHSRRILG